MAVVNIVEKFGADSLLERSWDLPPEVMTPLRAHVDVTPEGWIRDMWPLTVAIAAIVQPWIDEPIDVRSDAWFVSSVQADM